MSDYYDVLFMENLLGTKWEKSLPYVTPEMFGAVGDRTTDDTTAIQDCINYAVENVTNVLLPKSYKITQSITINGFNYQKFQLNGDILYTGSDAAILVTNMRRSSIEVGRITAPSGSCIKFYSNSNTSDYVSYSSFSFKQLYAGQKCIWFEIGASTGYINENTIWGGQLASGEYGIYADAKTRGQVQFKAYNIGFEGVTKGVSLIGAQYCSFINPRYGEMQNNTILETSGSVIHFLWMGTDKLRLSNLSLSNSTSGVIYASMCNSGLGVVSKSCLIDNGIVIPLEGKDGYYNANAETLDLAVANYLDQYPTYFSVDKDSVSLKLSKIYGIPNGINEFYVFFSFDNGTSFTLLDSSGNTIFSNTATVGWKWCRFTWHKTYGWLLEKLDRVALT